MKVLFFYTCLIAAGLTIAAKPLIAIAAIAGAVLFADHDSEGLAAVIFVVAVAGNLVYLFY